MSEFSRRNLVPEGELTEWASARVIHIQDVCDRDGPEVAEQVIRNSSPREARAIVNAYERLNDRLRRELRDLEADNTHSAREFRKLIGH